MQFLNKRSRRSTLILLFISFILLFTFYRLTYKPAKVSLYSNELETCVSATLDRYQTGVDLRNIVVYELPFQLAKQTLDTAQGGSGVDAEQRRVAALNAAAKQHHQPNSGKAKPLPLDEISLLSDTDSSSSSLDQDGSRFYLPYTGNGFIGLSILNKQQQQQSTASATPAANGLHATYHKTLSLPLLYNPLALVYGDSQLSKKEVVFTELANGLVNRIQCYQINKDCISVMSTVFAHRTRPSLLVEEISFNNPTKESVTFDIVQLGAHNWNQTKTTTEMINGVEFTVTKGIIDLTIDGKIKHLCVAIGSTRLASLIRIKEHDFNSRHTVLTVVKYSSTFLSGKLENLEPILASLESQVVAEAREALSLGVGTLKREHVEAWQEIWKSGFGISNSLYPGALNPDQINASIYYVLANIRAPLVEVAQLHDQHAPAVPGMAPSTKPSILEFNMERCYEGFSTLHATTLWRLPTNELEAASLASLWSLTLQKHGCLRLIDLGVHGILQAIILSLGGLKFTHHHLDLNLNPRQLHRNYYFRNVNYANMSLINIDIEVGADNHARLYVTLNELMSSAHTFYACDGGCIDPAVKLPKNQRLEFPVKLTEPLTAILYISSDKKHLDELKLTLHVKEVDIAPPQDVNTIELHKRGQSMGGLASLFWFLFIVLIIVFHLFLFKLIYRELVAAATGMSSGDGKPGSAPGSANKYYNDAYSGVVNNGGKSRYQRNARTV